MHGSLNGDRFAKQLTSGCSSFHGTAGLNWLEVLATNSDVVQQKAARIKLDFAERLNLQADCSSQVKRVASRFGLLASAGELATEFGITGWACGEALQVAEKSFHSWLDNKGGTGDFEKERLLSQVQH